MTDDEIKEAVQLALATRWTLERVAMGTALPDAVIALATDLAAAKARIAKLESEMK